MMELIRFQELGGKWLSWNRCYKVLGYKRNNEMIVTDVLSVCVVIYSLTFLKRQIREDIKRTIFQGQWFQGFQDLVLLFWNQKLCDRTKDLFLLYWKKLFYFV
eukprot:TRINITY_DN1338_c0_g1_i14.p2 TRINITY_DN1338_c0_g1~~TRINITY_DN1338_c0_g1_i14.p2  ORF type:complete len:103 (-),score=3.29 TRINITY_DN1338_c0_g1_i14:84-392(-)